MITTDNTLDIIKELNDARIKIFYNISARGAVMSFENALLNSAKDIILLADQDDIWLDNKVDCMKELLDKYDLVLSDCEVVDEETKQIDNSFFSFRGSKSGLFHNLYKNSHIGCYMGFKRNVLEIAIYFSSHMYD
jgi:glycosyltransferase involved in cell wall biosynthesis